MGYEELIQQKRIESCLKKLKAGFTCLKHGRYGSPHQRTVYVNSTVDKVMWKDEKDKKSSEPLSSFVKMQKGTDTPVFKRKKDVKEELCFSLVGDDRTLDLEFTKSEDRDFWYDVFQSILRYFRQKTHGLTSMEKEAEKDLQVLAKRWNFDIESNNWKFSKFLTKGTVFEESDYITLGRALSGNNSLETLELTELKMVDSLFMKAFGSLKSSLRGLTSLILSNNDLSDEAASAIALMVKDCKKLTLLDLSRNVITDQGFEDIAHAIESNPSLKTIIFDDNQVSDAGALVICECIPHSKLEKLTLNDNNISNEGAKQLALLLKKKQPLKHLELARNSIQFPEPGDDDESLELAASLLEAVDTDNYASLLLTSLEGADPNCQSEEDGKSPLHVASIRGDRLMLDYLIEHPYIDINTQDDHKKTPLYYAMFLKQFEIAKLLLDKGADFKIPDENNRTILHIAAELGCKAICKDLLDKFGDDWKALTNDKMTPLHFACKYSQKDVASLLLERDLKEMEKSRKDIAQDDNSSPPSTSSTQTISSELLYTNCQDTLGRTALHYVLMAQEPDVELAKMLVRFGSDISIIDNVGRTPLHNIPENLKQILLSETRHFMARKFSI